MVRGRMKWVGVVAAKGVWSVAWVVATVLGGAVTSEAQFSLSFNQRAANGTVYEVLVVPSPGPLTAGADEMRITTIAGSTSGVQSCSSTGGISGQNTAAVAGVDPNIGALHPFADVRRTNVLTPSSVSSVTFSSGGAGRLTIGGIDICANPADCTGGDPDASIFDLDGNVVASGSITGTAIPQACVATGVTALCSSGSFTTFGFGLARDNTTKACNSLPTTNRTVCGAPPTDGFTVQPGQVIVFIYNGNLANTGFSVGAAGFGIDTDGSNNPQCSANSVITADGQNPSAPPPPPPTPTNTPTLTPTPTDTPTLTPTHTPSLTPTLTPTQTPTLTPTQTPTETPTNTPTLTPTPTNTPTSTPTRTPTETPTQTPTRTFTPTLTPTITPSPTPPPIPVIPSPTSPAGLAMIGGFAAALVWMMRRVVRRS